jgi:DNA-binding GntR family transcriptional regulator
VSIADISPDSGLLSGQIYESLRAQIISGARTPGERLVESDIARVLSVSQAPVRDALKRLAHEGLVLHLPRRGNFVASISEEEAKRTYLVREPLEEIAAREFCAHARPSALAALEDALEEMRMAAAAADQVRLIDADVNFHRIVWESGENPILPRIFPMIETAIRKFTMISNRVYFNPDEIAASHSPLLESLREGEPDKAAAVHRAHVRAVWDRMSHSDRADL